MFERLRASRVMQERSTAVVETRRFKRLPRRRTAGAAWIEGAVQAGMNQDADQVSTFGNAG